MAGRDFGAELFGDSSTQVPAESGQDFSLDLFGEAQQQPSGQDFSADLFGGEKASPTPKMPAVPGPTAGLVSLINKQPAPQPEARPAGFMLRPEFVEEVRNSFADLPPEKRRAALEAEAAGSGVRAQAAQRILDEVRAQDKRQREVNLGREKMVELLANAPKKPVFGAGAPGKTQFPDVTPTFLEQMERVPEKERIQKRLALEEAGRAVTAAATSPEAIREREEMGRGGLEQVYRSLVDVGVPQAQAGGMAMNLVAQQGQIDKANQKLAELESYGLGDSEEAAGLRKTIEHYTQRQQTYMKDLAQKQQELSVAPAYRGVRQLSESKTFKEGLDVFASDPVAIVANLAAQSLPTSVPGLILGVINPALGAAAMGGSSLGVEFGSSLMEFAQDKGFDTRDPEQMAAFFADKDLLREGINKAGKRAGIVAAGDMFLAGLASKTMVPKRITSPVAKNVANMVSQMGAQAVGGGGFEAAAQVATEGAVTKPGEVLAEMLGELGGAPAEVYAQTRAAARDIDRQRAMDRLQEFRDRQPPAPPPLSQEDRQLLTDHAQQRLAELTRMANGTEEQIITTPEGKQVRIPAEPKQFMSPEEKAELEFLQKHSDNPEMLGRLYEISRPEPEPEAKAPPSTEALEGKLKELEQLAGIQAPPVQPAQTALPDRFLHGTSPENKEAILESNKFAPTGKRQYSYSQFGRQAVYFSPAEGWWLNKEKAAAGRAAVYPEQVDVRLDPSAQIVTINSIEDLDSLAQSVGYANGKELMRQLGVDDLDSEEYVRKAQSMTLKEFKKYELERRKSYMPADIAARVNTYADLAREFNAQGIGLETTAEQEEKSVERSWRDAKNYDKAYAEADTATQKLRDAGIDGIYVTKKFTESLPLEEAFDYPAGEQLAMLNTEKVRPITPESWMALRPSAAEQMEGKGAPLTEEAQAELDKLTRDQEEALAAREKLAKRTEGTSLIKVLKGTLNDGELSELGGRGRQVGKNPFLNLKAPKGQTGSSMEDMVDSGNLDLFLPEEMRPGHPNYDNQESAEYIREKLRNGEYYTNETEAAIEILDRDIEGLERQIQELLSEDEINKEIQYAVNEQREIDQALAEPAAEEAVGASAERAGEEEGFLKAQTEEELQAKQAEREAAEKKEAETKRKEEQKAAAPKAEEFVLTGSERAADEAAARGQMELAPAEEAKQPDMEAELSAENQDALEATIRAAKEEGPDAAEYMFRRRVMQATESGEPINVWSTKDRLVFLPEGAEQPKYARLVATIQPEGKENVRSIEEIDAEIREINKKIQGLIPKSGKPPAKGSKNYEEYQRLKERRKELVNQANALEGKGKQSFLSISPSVLRVSEKRAPSVTRKAKVLRRQFQEGKISEAEYVLYLNSAIDAAERAQLDKDLPTRVRGADILRERILAAKRRGEISEKAADMAEWFILKNPDLVEDLGISIRSPKEGEEGVAGRYLDLPRIIQLMKDAAKDDTIVHEILHHLERMMPPDIRAAIRKEWGKQLANAKKNAKTENEKKFFDLLFNFHYGNGTQKDFATATGMIKDGLVSYDNYQYVNPSEFWAVNGSEIVTGRYDAIRGGKLQRLKNWLKELAQKLKSVFGLESSAPIIRALDSLAKADGKFVTNKMLSEEAPSFASIKGKQEEPQPSTKKGVEDTWTLGRDEMGNIGFGPGAKAYRTIADIANQVLDKVSLKPISPELGRAMRNMKAKVDLVQNKIAEVATEMSKMSPEEREMISDIIEGELKAGVHPPQHVLNLAAAIQSMMTRQSQELVDLGMLSKEAANRWENKYLPRFYENTIRNEVNAWAKAARAVFMKQPVMRGIRGSSLRSRGMFETINAADLQDWLDQGWEQRDPDFDPKTSTETVVWRDYTRAEREKMGEIRDAMFRFVMGYNASQRDIALGRLYRDLADNYASKVPVEGYVRVPKGNAEGTGAPRYGALEGMYVPKEIMDHLSANDHAMANGVLKVYRAGLSKWKEGKTVLNPVSHANNIISNVTMAHFAGVSYWDGQKYAGAIRDLIKNDDMVKEADEVGLFGGTFNQTELMKSMPPQLKAMANMTESRLANFGERLWDLLAYTVEVGGKKYGARPVLQWAYENEDTFFRYVIYRDARNRGMSSEDARDYSQQFIFTYDDLPKGARMLRDFAIPFFSYGYKVVPVLARTALVYPWRYAAPATVAYTANAAMYAMAASLGGDPDDWWGKVLYKYVTDEEFRNKAKAIEADERRHLPEWLKGHSGILSTPKAIRMGLDDVTGLPMFLDISRIFPGGDLLDANNNAGGVAFFQPLMPTNPVLNTLVAMLANKDMFLGKDVVAKTDTDAEKAQKRAAWIWKQAAPAISVGNYHFDRGMNTIAQMTGKPITVDAGPLGIVSYTGVGKDGLPIQPKHAMLQTMGIKIRPYDLEISKGFEETAKRQLIRELDFAISRVNRQESKGTISSEAAKAERQKLIEKKQNVGKGLTLGGEEKK